jgi:hypothetical protein
LVLLIVYTLSSTKLEIRAKWFLPGSEGAGGERESVEGRGGEITQTLYAYMNKKIYLKIKKLKSLCTKKNIAKIEKFYQLLKFIIFLYF